ncbi:MAG: Gfo/Idh/MocA family oxidoreductase [Kiloniellales bacterium]|nr:Gfo/Idh/MocA family oxidoreductase [Kiloniellales bacterium]
MKPGIAFIGLGIMGHRMLTNMNAHGGFTLVGGWDPSARARDRTRAAFPDLPLVEDPAEIVAAPETEVVYIACPPAAHAEHALAALAAGKAIWCEKPLGVELAESRALVEAVEAAGAKNAINFPFADAQAANLIDRELKAGGLGEVAGVDIRLHFARWPRDWQADAIWLAERAEGGYVREVFSHFVFLIQRLFGPAVLRDAGLRYPEDPRLCETHFTALLDCDGVPVSAAGSSGGTGPDQVEITVWGEERAYRLWDWNRLKSSANGAWRDELTELENPRQDGYMRMLDDFRAFLAGQPNSMPSFRDALSVQEIVEGILAR